VPRVLHDTDPTTKTGLDQIQNTDRVANSSRLAARRRASRMLGPTAARSIAERWAAWARCACRMPKARSNQPWATATGRTSRPRFTYHLTVAW